MSWGLYADSSVETCQYLWAHLVDGGDLCWRDGYVCCVVFQLLSVWGQGFMCSAHVLLKLRLPTLDVRLKRS